MCKRGSVTLLRVGPHWLLLLVLTWTLRTCKASKLVVLSFLMPISGVLFSHLFLGDELMFSVLIGTGLVASRIYLVNMGH